MQKIILLLFLSFSLIQPLSAQTYERLNLDFTVDGKLLKTPLMGGLNTPQLSKVDLNNDGIQDLYIFDRAANVHLCFLHDGTTNSLNYTFAPEYTQNFPKVEHFVLLRDYDQDGIMDMFSFSDVPGVSGITVFKGYYENDRIAFERYPFPATQDFKVLYFPLLSGTLIPLYVALNDYPAIDDIDNDGDLDILTFNSSGGFLEYFVNQSIEKGYGTDSLIYDISDNCWGGFYESGLSPAVDLSNEEGRCFDAAQIVETRHAGSTVLSLNLDEDCDKEVLLGDLSFDNLILLRNGGNCQEAWITDQDIDFPSYNTPAKVDLFPASYHLDMDNDGLKDLMVCPNDGDNTSDYFNMWFYKNIGTKEVAQFDFQTQTLLTDETLDFGSGSNPVFVDYNGDGLLDIVLGTLGYYIDSGNRDARLFLLENTGTINKPAYELVNSNLLNFSQFEGQSWNFTPTFGDLDGDGDEDLLVGEEFGAIFFVENNGGAGNPFQANMILPNYMDIDIGSSSTPHLADVNQDGLLDLLVGERNGNINYFQNIGSKTQATFNPDPTIAPNTQLFGRIDAREPGFITGFSAPSLIKTPNGQKIVTGTANGQLELYTINETAFEETFELESNAMGDIQEGRRSKATFADINNDGKLEALVGNYRGGLAMYQTDIINDRSVATKNINFDKKITIYPNPTQEKIQWKGDLNVDQIRLTSIVGESVFEINIKPAQQQIILPNYLKNGLYYLSFFKEETILEVHKLVVQK